LNVLKAEEIVLKSQKRKMKRIVPHLVRIRPQIYPLLYPPQQNKTLDLQGETLGIPDKNYNSLLPMLLNLTS